MSYGQIVSFIWSIADLIRDSFRRGEYQNVILPLTVLRRLDCVLAPTKKRVLETNAKLHGKLENLDPQLRKASGFAFYNTSRYDFEKLLADAPNLAANLRNYIAGFSENMRDVLEKFDFDNTIRRLAEAGLLFQVLERFKNVDLHPDRVPNPMMGTIFEELIRKFNEALNENPGEHFTPRDVVHLMADVLLAGDEQRIAKRGVAVTLHDPCCGSGGMLTITKDHIIGSPDREGINKTADVHLFGQEVNPSTFAVSKSDLFMKSADGRDAENILFGSTLSNDRHGERLFDYLIANPPYGKDWKRDKEAVEEEYARGAAGRFSPGLPSISDGQFLFLQHMLSHMHKVEDGGSRVAIIMNGSPLFTGDAGSGPSEIRRWILENDWLEALIALPEQLFYNTGIATYVWVLTNRKAAERKGKVQLINATTFWTPMRRSLGNKRREIPNERGKQILELLREFKEGEFSKIYPTTYFGYRKITVERPLKLNFQISAERIARLDDEPGFKKLTTSTKKKEQERLKEIAAGTERQKEIKEFLTRQAKPATQKPITNREEFRDMLKAAAKTSSVRLDAIELKATMNALSERDESSEPCCDACGEIEADPELRDTENVPLSESIRDYFNREVRPYVPDAWINETVRDHKDSEIGKVGYEINFNRYFYKYQPPRPLEEIEADIKTIEGDILNLLREVTA
jgi:type I restriction enzyme M protein